jgi:thiol-disulfide isomerase/thioredoxin
MKQSIIVLLHILTSFFCYSQVLIKGKIIDSIRSGAILYEPINGASNNHLIAKPDFQLIVNASGYFQKTLQIHSPVVITIVIGQTPLWLLVEPNDTINVEVNTSKFDKFSPNDGIQLTGKNAEGNKLYNTFNYQPIKKIIKFQKLIDSLQFKENLDLRTVEYALAQVTYPFDSLLNKGKITKKFYDVITNDTKGVLLIQLIKFAFFEKKLALSDAFILAKQLYENYPVTDEISKAGLYGSSIAYYYYYSKARKYYSDYLLADSIYSVNGKSVFINSNLVPWLYAPKGIQEIDWAISLIQLKQLFSSNFGKRDVEAYLALFPDSKMKQYLSPPYFSLTEVKDKTKDDSAFTFMPTDSINSFTELISKFKGKKLFVDFWATWCVACKLEFTTNSKLDQFCDENNIQRLYVAFEISSTKKNLKKDVYAYNLKGIHLAANDKLIQDITKRFYPGEDSYNIPRYLLINENGEIVHDDAARPSSGNTLFSQMRSAFKLGN